MIQNAVNQAMLQVLPHLLEEVRSEQLQQLVLPLVIHILGKQDKQVILSVQHAQQLTVSTKSVIVSAHSQMQPLLQAGAQSLDICTRIIVALQEGHLPDWLDCMHSSNRSILSADLLCHEPSAEPV